MATQTVPDSLIEHLRCHTREQAVIQQTVDVGVGWWNDNDRELQGGPVTGGGSATGIQPITRRHLFSLADSAIESEEGALRLLWHSLAWGTGRRHRNNKRRIASVLGDDSGARDLQRAADASRRDPEEAFTILRARRRNRFAWLGPNFFTKYLYFAGGGRPEHPSLIVDQYVRAALHRETGDLQFRYVSQYSVNQYLETIETLASFANAASAAVGRRVFGDEVERWAFGSRADSPESRTDRGSAL